MGNSRSMKKNNQAAVCTISTSSGGDDKDMTLPEKIEPLWVAPPRRTSTGRRTRRNNNNNNNNIQFKIPKHNDLFKEKTIISINLRGIEEAEEDEEGGEGGELQHQEQVQQARAQQDFDQVVESSSINNESNNISNATTATAAETFDPDVVSMDVTREKMDGLVLYRGSGSSSGSNSSSRMKDENEIATCKKVQGGKYQIYKFHPVYFGQQPILNNNESQLLLYLYATIDIKTFMVTLVNQPLYPKYQIIDGPKHTKEHYVIRLPKPKNNKGGTTSQQHQTPHQQSQLNDSDDEEDDDDERMMNDSIAVWNNRENDTWNHVEIFQNNRNCGRSVDDDPQRLEEEQQQPPFEGLEEEDDEVDIGLIFYFIIIYDSTVQWKKITRDVLIQTAAAVLFIVFIKYCK